MLALALAEVATAPGPAMVTLTGKLVWVKAAETVELVLSVSVWGLVEPVKAPAKLVNDQSLAGVAVTITLLPQVYNPPVGFRVMNPEPVTLVPSVQVLDARKVAVSVVLAVRVKLAELLLPLYPIPLQLPKEYPVEGDAVRLTVDPQG